MVLVIQLGGSQVHSGWLDATCGFPLLSVTLLIVHMSLSHQDYELSGVVSFLALYPEDLAQCTRTGSVTLWREGIHNY